MSQDFEEKTVIASVTTMNMSRPTFEKANPCLIQYSGSELGKRYELDKSPLKLGRGSETDLLIQDQSVSRKHAEIIQENDHVYVVDLESANGTFINDKRLVHNVKTELRDQDMVQFGTAMFKFFAHNNPDGFIHDKIYRMATVDNGTQIYNKQYLIDVLHSQLKLCRATGKSFAIIYFDLDFFKKVNDTFGHNAGDELLLELATTVKSMIRKDDIFGRFGGEEFIIVLPNTTFNVAIEAAERICHSIANHVFRLNTEENGKKKTIQHKQTISIGVSELLPEHATVEDVLQSADQKLYQSKKQGRNRVTY